MIRQYILTNWEWQFSHLLHEQAICISARWQRAFSPSKDTEDHTESDGCWENNSWNSNFPSFILDVDFEGQCSLDPAGQGAKSKGQGSSNIMDFFVIRKLRDEQIMTCGGTFRKDIRSQWNSEGEKVDEVMSQ